MTTKYKVTRTSGQHQKYPLQNSYKEALDLIRSLWLPDGYYDNPVTFKFKHLPNGNTEVQHQTADFLIEQVQT